MGISWCNKAYENHKVFGGNMSNGKLSVNEKVNMKFETVEELVTYLTNADEGAEESTRGQVFEIVSDLADILAHNKEAMAVFSKYMGNKVK